MPRVTKRPFGETVRGELCHIFSLQNDTGASVGITEYGATVVEMNCADKYGSIDNICLRYNTLSEYEQQQVYLGAMIGRFANRIGGASYQIDDQSVKLIANQDENLLHGGESSFAHRTWELESLAVVDEVPTLILSLNSPDGDAGFPGNLNVRTTFQLYEDNRLRLTLAAETDLRTPVSMTHHPYFNLAPKSESLATHTFQIYSGEITEVDIAQIPTGKLFDVGDSVFDLRQPKNITDYLATKSDELLTANGYDHNYCFEPWDEHNPELIRQARVEESDSGRVLELFSTLPGLQFYSGNHLAEAKFKKHQAFCLEPQFYPDSPNKPQFPFQWTLPERPFQHVIEWKMSAL